MTGSIGNTAQIESTYLSGSNERSGKRLMLTREYLVAKGMDAKLALREAMILHRRQKCQSTAPTAR